MFPSCPLFMFHFSFVCSMSFPRFFLVFLPCLFHIRFFFFAFYLFFVLFFICFQFVLHLFSIFLMFVFPLLFFLHLFLISSSFVLHLFFFFHSFIIHYLFVLHFILIYFFHSPFFHEAKYGSRSRLNTVLSRDRFSARNFLEVNEWMSRRNAKFSKKDSARHTWFQDKGAAVIQIERHIHILTLWHSKSLTYTGCSILLNFFKSIWN